MKRTCNLILVSCTILILMGLLFACNRKEDISLDTFEGDYQGSFVGNYFDPNLDSQYNYLQEANYRITKTSDNTFSLCPIIGLPLGTFTEECPNELTTTLTVESNGEISGAYTYQATDSLWEYWDGTLRLQYKNKTGNTVGEFTAKTAVTAVPGVYHQYDIEEGELIFTRL